MDLQMPLMDGFEASAMLRNDPTLASMPILAMTAHAMVQEREQCLAVGMNDFISKPIDPETLATTLAQWLPVERAKVIATASLELEQAPRTWSDLEVIPGVSREAGLAIFSGDVPLYEKMLGRFLELEANAAATIRSTLARGDRKGAGIKAHSMVAVAGTIGALELSTMARALENAIRSGESAATAALVDTFEVELAAILEGLKGHVGTA